MERKSLHVDVLVLRMIPTFLLVNIAKLSRETVSYLEKSLLRTEVR